MNSVDYKIRDLGVIGDQNTAALVARDGSIVWYCPERFDRPSLFAALLAPNGGNWRFEIPDTAPGTRFHLSDSAVLATTFLYSGGEITLMDWMPLGEDVPRGAICRMISAAPQDITMIFAPSPNYGTNFPSLEMAAGGVHVEDHLILFASHALSILGEAVHMSVPHGEAGWAVLAPRHTLWPDMPAIVGWRTITLNRWSELAADDKESSVYVDLVRDSLRALRLLTHAASGGIIAAVTTSLPEVPNGQRNYDYRYVWIRDAGMIASALTRSSGAFQQASSFLDFIASNHVCSEEILLPPALSLDGTAMPEERPLQALSGRDGIRPAVAGNNAHSQLQLDALGNVLLVAKLKYALSQERPHFALVAEIAEFLVANWRRPDHGLWEEQGERQYTSSKVIMARGLEYIAAYGSDEQAAFWRTAAQNIRAYVAANCITPSGAYAVVAGSDAVDVSAALFPVWAYCDADTPEMLATIREIERDLADGELYRRRLEEFDSAKEGVFLAGALWVAQYWIVRKDSIKARRIIDAVLIYTNDLGLFAEEADPRTGDMVGNFPQSFVHAAFVGTVFDLANLIDETTITPIGERSMTGKLQGKIAIITGSDSGIGQATATVFAQEGADIAVTWYQDRAGAEKTAESIRAAGRRAHVQQLDQRDPAQVAQLFAEVSQALGTPFILVNAGGIDSVGKHVADMSVEEWDDRIRTNLYGPFYCCQQFIRARKQAGGGGRIVNITSVHEEIPRAGAAGYDSSKGALRNLTRTLALELAPDHIGVNNLAPGMVLTPMNQAAIDDPKELDKQVQSIPLKRAAQPHEIAKLALYLASEDADYVTGQSFTIDGGLSMNLGQGA